MNRIIIIVAAVLVAMIAGCKEDDNEKYIVTFETRGGSAVTAQTIEQGEKVRQPEEPTKEGFEFVAWYKGRALADEWDFTSGIVNEAMTLYAGWEQNTYTVDFKSNGGSAVTSETVAKGEKVTKPSPDPTRTGYEFVTWCKELGLSFEWKFETDIVNADMKLYAKWEIAKYTVTFESNGGSEVVSQSIGYNEKVTMPSPNPTKAGFGFEAWYKDSDMTEQWDFDTETVTEAMTLYAKWGPPIDVTGIALNENSFVLGVGETTTLTYTIMPSNATNQTTSWSTDNAAVASVNPTTGEITGLKLGSATITATTEDGEFSDQCAITVLILRNPSFELSSGGEGEGPNTPIQDWINVPQSWFTSYYGSVANYDATKTDRQAATGWNTFLGSGNGSFFRNQGALDGNVGIRNQPNYSSGCYQLIKVEPNATYFISANIGFRANAAGQRFRDDETIKVLYPDGTRFYELPIPGNPNLGVTSGQNQVLIDVSGTFTVPVGITQLRVQFDFRSPRPLTVFDNVILYKVED